MFSFLTSTLAPVILLLFTGYGLYRIKLLNDGFVEAGSRLVFSVALPALLFLSVSQADFTRTASPVMLICGIGGTLLFVTLCLIYCQRNIHPASARGVVVQGAFRANMGIIGLAYCANTYPEQGLAIASVYLGFVTLLFNVLSVFVLTYALSARRSATVYATAILRNPLIIAILLALPISYWQIRLPVLLVATGEYFAQLTLPLALLCTGASLQFRSFSKDRHGLWIAVVGKCVLYPALIVAMGYIAGLRGVKLGVILLMSIAPTAAASYVMARQLGGDHRLAASIIAVTTVISLPVTAVAFATLHTMGLL